MIKNHLIFLIQFQNERLTEILQLSDATFYDNIKTIYQFIKPFLDKKKIFIFEEYGAFNFLTVVTPYNVNKSYLPPSSHLIHIENRDM